MPGGSHFVVFVGAAVTLLLIPGPAVAFIVARSGAHGRRAGLVSVLGVHSATCVHVLGAVLGFSAVLVASATAYTAVKLVGGVYLIALGVRALRGAGRSADAPEAAPVSIRRLFREGFAVNVLNPKTALFFLAFLPQFVAKGHGPVWFQTLFLGAAFVALGLVTDSLYAVFGASVGARWRSARSCRITARVEGGVLIALGIATMLFPARRRAVGT
jgi:threonine/homoserine/homoserine lactone efflux protein